MGPGSRTPLPAFGKAALLVAVAAATAIFPLFHAKPARADALPLDPSLFPDLNTLLSETVRNALVKTVGLSTIHRAYLPATPLGSQLGFDAGIELTLVRVPEDFATALQSAGVSSGQAPPFLPVPRLHVHKGLGESINIGFSAMVYQGMRIYGGDVGFVLKRPEEGVTLGARLTYSRAVIQMVDAETWSPEILLSRQLDFADPYVGVGYAFCNGTLTITREVPPLGPVTRTGTGSSQAVYSFVGVRFVAREIGLGLALEGSFSGGGAHTLGTRAGISF